MPRTAHGRSLLKAGPSRPPKRKPQRNAALNALETAERENLDDTKIPKHRLGEIEDEDNEAETRAEADGRSNKRRKVHNDQDKEEDVEEGSDLEGGTWHTGVNEDDEDSDLDSDEAFGESDEEKFADFTFRGSGTNQSKTKTVKARRIKEIDLDEDMDDEASGQSQDDDEDSDDLGDEAIDLATAWDLDDVQEVEAKRSKSAKNGKGNSRRVRNKSESEDSDDITDADGDEDDDERSRDSSSRLSISEDEMQGDAAGLRSFVEELSSTREDSKKRTKFDRQALPSEPSRFGLPPSKLSAADLLQYVKDPTQRQSLKIVQSAERSGPEEYKGGIPGKLSAPLAKRQQDRLNRGAAYDKSKETLNRWVDTVKQNRRAEHLSFPLADHAKESALGQKQLIPTTQSAPANELEATIDKIMQESGMANGKGHSTEDHEQAFEEMAERTMDVDEVKARRAELRMARELMFREEIRAKRIKKIKSKAFRRVHRKERDKIEAQQREALNAAGLLNSDDERETQDRRRAEERMGARHRESKWAKGVKQAGKGAWDDDARAGVTDLAKRDEELRRRIEGKAVVDADALSEESGSESDYDADSDAENQNINRKMDALEFIGSSATGSRLGEMAFMQRAEAARKAANDEELQRLRFAMDDRATGPGASDEDQEEVTGRQKFGVKTQPKKQTRQRNVQNEFEAPLSDEENGEERRSPVATEVPEAHANTASAAKLQPQVQQNGHNGPQRTNPHAHKNKQSTNAKKSQQSETTLDDYTSSSESEAEAQVNLNPDDAKAALAAAIFAGPDDVVKEFAKEKAELVEDEGDQVIDNTLPGWGSWTGAGVSKREQKKSKGRFLTTIKGVAADKRQDAKLERVMVNEKRIKKNGKYLATELPHPFESRQQYERSLRLPIGPEWSTVNHYQESIKPRILLKQGNVIKPMAKPLV